MNLHEYQAKNILLKYNLPVLNGNVCSTIDEVECYISNNINKGPWAVKCQIQAGGRGKSGGICIAHSTIDILEFANKWLGNRLVTHQTNDVGELVHSILIEPAVKIIHEFYLSVLIDRNESVIMCMASIYGGINIENIEKKTHHSVYKITIDPLVGMYPYQGRKLACKLGLLGIKINQFAEIVVQITKILLEKDLMLIEINPLAITKDDNFICIDAKIISDHNAIFRQSELLNIYHTNKTNNILFNNTLDSINYVPLEGNIGCMVNGAGLAMATMDLIKSLGGIPANFLDIGGGANTEHIILAFQIILKDIKVKAILVNIFGGIVCCNMVANSIITALSTYNTTHNIPPIIVRLEGNNAKLGSKRLIDSAFNIIVTDNLVYAIQQVVNSVK